MNFTYSELYNYFGGILGLIVATVILAFTERGNNIKFSLSLLLIVSSLMVIFGALNYSGKVIHLPFLIRMDSPLHFLFGPAAYFYIISSFRTNFKFRFIHLLHLLPFLINILFFLPLYLQSNSEKLIYYQTWTSHGSYGMPFQYLLKILYGFLYFCLQIIFFVRKYPEKPVGAGKRPYAITWYYVFFASQFIMIGSMMLDNLFNLDLLHDPYRFAVNMMTLFLFLASIALLFFPQILYGKDALESNQQKKYSYSMLNPVDQQGILDSLAGHLNSGDLPFRNPEITLNKLATELNTSPHQLSRAINESTGMNFNDYLNQYRIEYAKKLLTSPDYHKFTIDAIAREAGFNSRSPFYNAFKKQTGITPRQYIINSGNGSGKKPVDHER